MGYKTVEEGKHAILYDAHGRGTLIVGPRRVSMLIDADSIINIASCVVLSSVFIRGPYINNEDRVTINVK